LRRDWQSHCDDWRFVFLAPLLLGARPPRLAGLTRPWGHMGRGALLAVGTEDGEGLVDGFNFGTPRYKCKSRQRVYEVCVGTEMDVTALADAALQRAGGGDAQGEGAS
jgi:hypothetical protein